LPSRPEIDFLIACASPIIASAVPPRDVDWRRLEALASFHRVRGLLLERVVEQRLVPETLRAEWAASLRADAVRALVLTGELVALAEGFSAAGIPVLPHKGPLLAEAAYGDLALREYADLDLLVRPEDLRRSIELLAARGYRPAERLGWLSPEALRRWTGEICYSSGRGIAVDLHWRLTPRHYPVELDPELLWRSCGTIALAGTNLPTLRPEAAFLLLAVHGAKHLWKAIGWLADLAWLVRNGFDWKSALELAQSARCGRPFPLAASLVSRVFNVESSPEVAAAIGKDPAVERLQARVLARWHEGPLETPRSPELFAFAATLSPSRAATLRHLAGLVLDPTENDWQAHRLPQRLFRLYAPARLARLAAKYLRR
jgi:hypothetical protein